MITTVPSGHRSRPAVEVQGAWTADGGDIVRYADWNGANQQWQLNKVG